MPLSLILTLAFPLLELCDLAGTRGFFLQLGRENVAVVCRKLLCLRNQFAIPRCTLSFLENRRFGLMCVYLSHSFSTKQAAPPLARIGLSRPAANQSVAHSTSIDGFAKARRCQVCEDRGQMRIHALLTKNHESLRFSCLATSLSLPPHSQPSLKCSLVLR
jgi:hypothetical protein